MDDVAGFIRSHLRFAGPGLYRLADPHLMYLDQKQAEDYLSVKENATYSDGFHQETIELIKANTDSFLQGNKILLIDLGPGYPDNMLPVITKAVEKGIDLTYAPVDINDFYLGISFQAASKHLPPERILPIRANFRDAAGHLPSYSQFDSAYAYMGLTFMNFGPAKSARLLKDICQKQACAVAATELITEANPVEDIESHYNIRENHAFSFGPLRLMGFSQKDVETTSPFNNRRMRIEHRHTFKKDSEAGGVRFKKGDTVITSMSYRRDLETLKAKLRMVFADTTTKVSPSGNTALTFSYSRPAQNSFTPIA